jgi:hypothetical protein
MDYEDSVFHIGESYGSGGSHSPARGLYELHIGWGLHMHTVLRRSRYQLAENLGDSYRQDPTSTDRTPRR